ncbi:MAG TPA: aminoacyl-tRNA hydrolase, partial [Streptosporangiaceae bacterium]
MRWPRRLARSQAASQEQVDGVQMNGERWLVAGLGNPGAQYAGNRHNAGFMVADLLAARVGSGFRRDRARSQAASVRLAGVPAILAKPMSFMNLSGEPIVAMTRFYKIPA